MNRKINDIDCGTRILKPHRTHLTRRHFLLGVAAVSVSAVIPLTISCSSTPVHDIHGQLSDEDFSTLIQVQNHLFPSDSNSPGAEDLHAATYLTWVLSDPKKDPEDVQQLKDGLKWINETSKTLFDSNFNDLGFDEKEKALRTLETESYGKSWISIVLTNIFEALLSDPIYGSNTNKSGWNWLEHAPGNPRPTAVNKYNPVAL